MHRSLPLPSLLLIAMVGLASACASGGTNGARADRRCTLRPTDSVFARGGSVYRDCAVDREARLITRDIRPDYAAGRGCNSAVVEFVVGTDGLPEVETVRTVRSTSTSFARSVIEIVPRLRYEPALADGVRVRQIVAEERSVAVVVVVARAGSAPPPTTTSLLIGVRTTSRAAGGS